VTTVPDQTGATKFKTLIEKNLPPSSKTVGQKIEGHLHVKCVRPIFGLSNCNLKLEDLAPVLAYFCDYQYIYFSEKTQNSSTPGAVPNETNGRLWHRLIEILGLEEPCINARRTIKMAKKRWCYHQLRRLG
jgi:hypothetical protein